MTNEMIARIDSLLNDESFTAELSSVTTPDEAIALFSAHGAALTLEDLSELRAIQADGELTEDSLEQVSGGRFVMPNPVPPFPNILKYSPAILTLIRLLGVKAAEIVTHQDLDGNGRIGR